MTENIKEPLVEKPKANSHQVLFRFLLLTRYFPYGLGLRFRLLSFV